ncbi:MAG: hypothetical protein GY849_13125 [Deltaproteobacteria bacterium]|nr:hypothetical protein [Deltaproteobacteria bacterium]
MDFDIDRVIQDMIVAVVGVVKEEHGDISRYAKEIIEAEKETMTELSELRINGEITDDEFQSELEDEKDTLVAQLKAVAVMELAMTQKAVNAAIDVLVKAVGVAASSVL